LYRAVGKLDVVSPLATLARGYSITKKEGQIVFKASQLKPGDKVNIILAQGQVDCEVQGVKEHFYA
jgi:exodeoxyribonuclease VII large subunit